MRSRYSAYVLGLADYLLSTWAPETRPPSLELATEQPTKWLGLDIKQFRQADPESATVEFVARYRIAGRAHRLHETSRFIRNDGHWLYVDGEMRD